MASSATFFTGSTRCDFRRFPKAKSNAKGKYSEAVLDLGADLVVHLTECSGVMYRPNISCKPKGFGFKKQGAQPFYQDGAKAKREVPPPPKAEAKAKALEAKKAVLKGIHSHNEKIPTSPTFHHPKTRWSTPRRNRLDHCAIIKEPLTAESAVKTEDNNTRKFIVDIKANRHQIKQAVKRPCDPDVAKVSTLIRPDGEKKACVPLAPDYDALDAANTIGIIETESSWLILNKTLFSPLKKKVMVIKRTHSLECNILLLRCNII
ncbi:LOW QUALITY PROTEIN: 60S ribosomal protein L23a-like [Fukomys damarensis]|uniref:LOW QUALITY PROTEIN: 60S ribosomal protein L23a-like n=1 Tax=Fukomys damarensis TaxID=885580 RepID=UPI0014556423|nr:LOW QUALITY PROTEIN: 60S ribosomal protein L23a-like [Fukomys damarensis]